MHVKILEYSTLYTCLSFLCREWRGYLFADHTLYERETSWKTTTTR